MGTLTKSENSSHSESLAYKGLRCALKDFLVAVITFYFFISHIL